MKGRCHILVMFLLLRSWYFDAVYNTVLRTVFAWLIPIGELTLYFSIELLNINTLFLLSRHSVHLFVPNDPQGLVPGVLALYSIVDEGPCCTG